MARQPPKSRYLPESSLSSDISMNKGQLSEICLIKETTLINLRRISLTVISLILLNFHFKCNKETLSIISRCWIFLMLHATSHMTYLCWLKVMATYLYLTYPTLQLHVQYQPTTDIFTCSSTCPPPTIALPHCHFT
jgi:hypothetical protein